MPPLLSPHPNVRFLRMARDPRMLADVHRHCDAWCEQCRVTEHCLAFLCTKEFLRRRGRPPAKFLAAGDAIELRLEITALTPTPVAPRDDRRRQAVDATDDDALAAIALDYMTSSARVLEMCRASDRLIPIKRRPAPVDVIARFHSGIYFKTTRALVGRALAVSGIPSRAADADACAVQVFVYAARSVPALMRLPDDVDRRTLIALLESLLQGLDCRFPEARAASRRVIEITAGVEQKATRSVRSAKFDIADAELGRRR